jgi:hypothetical protein
MVYASAYWFSLTITIYHFKLYIYFFPSLILIRERDIKRDMERDEERERCVDIRREIGNRDYCRYRLGNSKAILKHNYGCCFRQPWTSGAILQIV